VVPPIKARAVAPRVLEDVAERVAGLRRRGQDLEVIAVVEHAAAPAEEAVDPARDPHRPALDAPRARRGRVGFAHEVDVVALDRELADPELALATAVDERPAQH